MGAAQAKSVTKEVTKSDKQRNNEFNMYTIAPEGFMCKTNNMPKDNNIHTIANIIIYFLILFTIIFISYLLYNGVIK
jgi:hypothetical protein